MTPPHCYVFCAEGSVQESRISQSSFRLSKRKLVGGVMTPPYTANRYKITYPAGRQCRAARRNQRNIIRFDPDGSKLNCSAVSPLPTKDFAFAGTPELLRPYLSSRQAMPGNSKPSRNSREAPPPVEMWVMELAKPSCSQAAAESPPPTMVTASLSARA